MTALVDAVFTYDTVGGTATENQDYTATGGTLTIPAGSISRTITVPVRGDLLYEEDEEFTLVLSDPVNALLSLGYTLVYNEISSLLDGYCNTTVGASRFSAMYSRE